VSDNEKQLYGRSREKKQMRRKTGRAARKKG
jgi:hypothetical protein